MAEEGKKFSDLTKIEAFEVSKSYVYLMREAKTETGYEDVIVLGSKFVDSLALPEGDMLKSVYDKNDDGKVDSAQSADFASVAGSVDWDTITNVPSSFPPSAHTHGAADVTDFAAAVAALLIAGDNITIDVEEGEITINSTAEGGGGGTVTSVKLATESSAFNISGTNPVTTSGTINIGLKSGSDLQQLEALSAYGFAYRSSEGWVVDDEIPWAALTNVPDFADVATSGKYSDLSGTPSLAAVATSGDYEDLDNLPSLAAVATSGKYTDLTDTPTLGTAAAADTGDFDAAGAASSAQSYAIQRGNHTGTQAADTISDFAAAVYTATAAILQQGSNITLTPDSKAETITIAASGGGGGGSGTKTIFAYSAWVENNPPTANFATLGVREYETGVPQAVMVFDDAVAQSAYALAYIKEGANLSSGISLGVLMSSDAASGDVGWTVNLGRFSSSGGTIDWGNAKTITAAAVPGSADETVVMAATIASGDLPSGLTDEEWVLVKLTSDVANWTADDVACVLGVSGKAVA